MSRKTERLLNHTARDLNIDLTEPDLVDLLALQCVLCVRTNDALLPHLTKNRLCYADTLIFSAFFVRLQCVRHTSNEETADFFDDRFMPHIANALKRYFIKKPEIAYKMLNNRINFYNDLCSQNSISDQQTVLTEEFSYIIALDCDFPSYQDYSKSSPLLVTDISDNFELTIEINAYIHSIVITTKNTIPRIRDNLRTLGERKTD